MRYTDGMETIVATWGPGLPIENEVVACYLSGCRDT
jgi:hypothetical protein